MAGRGYAFREQELFHLLGKTKQMHPVQGQTHLLQLTISEFASPPLPCSPNPVYTKEPSQLHSAPVQLHPGAV